MRDMDIIRGNRDTEDIHSRKVKEKDLGRQHDPKQSAKVKHDEVLKHTIEKDNDEPIDTRIRKQVVEERIPIEIWSRRDYREIISSTQYERDECRIEWIEDEWKLMVPQEMMKEANQICLT